MSQEILRLEVVRFSHAWSWIVKNKTYLQKTLITRNYVNMLTRVWQELEYRIDVCRVTRGAHIEHL